MHDFAKYIYAMAKLRPFMLSLWTKKESTHLQDLLSLCPPDLPHCLFAKPTLTERLKTWLVNEV